MRSHQCTSVCMFQTMCACTSVCCYIRCACELFNFHQIGRMGYKKTYVEKNSFDVCLSDKNLRQSSWFHNIINTSVSFAVYDTQISISSLRSLLCHGLGTSELLLNEQNFQVAAHCHRKHNCPKLDELCKQYIDNTAEKLTAFNVMTTLNATLSFEPVPERAQQKCVEFIARHISTMLM